MARIFTNGFENNTATTKLDQWNANTGSPTIGTAAIRTGARAGTITSATSGTAKGFGYAWLATNGNGPYFLRFYLDIVTAPNADTTIAAFQTDVGTQQVTVVLTTTRTLKLFTQDGAVQIGSASSAITAGAFNRIELSMNNTPASGSKTAALLLNGATVASSSTLTSTNMTAGVINFNLGVNWEGEAMTTGSLAFDDVALNDATGSFQTTYPGAGSVIYLRPDSAGDANTFSTQTGGTAGAGNNFTRVNEVTSDGATSFNGATTLNLTDMFNMGASGIGAGDTVNVVHVNGNFRASTTTTTPTFKFQIEKTASGTKTQSAAIHPVTTAFTTNELSSSATNNSPITLYQDPDGSAWTQTTLDSMQAGYIITTAGTTNRVDISTLWVVVDYTPSGVSPNTPSVNDTVTVSENISISIISSSVRTPSVFDSVTVSENVSILVNGHQDNFFFFF